jgi:excisionase family DNA binding protein
MQGTGGVAGGPLLTVKEAADRLKVSTATVYALCEAGELAFTRVSTHAIRIAEVDLAAYLGRLRVHCAPTRRGAPSR